MPKVFAGTVFCFPYIKLCTSEKWSGKFGLHCFCTFATRNIDKSSLLGFKSEEYHISCTKGFYLSPVLLEDWKENEDPIVTFRLWTYAGQYSTHQSSGSGDGSKLPLH